MPSNKNAVIRYMYLDQMLSDRYNKYTCEDLLINVNERLKFAGYPTIGGDQNDYERYLRSGKRVIQLDLQALQEAPFNMEIDSSEKMYGAPIYRYADQTQSLFNKPLSEDEKRLLQEVLNTLGQFSGLDCFEWLNDLQERLNDHKSFGGDQDKPETLCPRKIISFSTNRYLAGKDYLGVLFSLISHKKVVEVDYAPFGETARRIRLYPYLLKQFNDRWYLIGTPVATEKFPYQSEFFVDLPLDRIHDISAVYTEEYIDCPVDIEERFEDIVGVTWLQDEKMTEIVLAVRDTYIGYVETRPIHNSQFRYSKERQFSLHDDYPGFEGYTFFGINVKPNRELYNLIYRFGRDIILVSPKNIRGQMISEMEDVLKKLIQGGVHIEK